MQSKIIEKRIELEILEQYHQDTTRFCELNESYLAPIRRLPVEVLTNIFELCCIDGICFVECSRFRTVTHCPQLVLSAVSHFWREVVTSRPGLWSTIDLRPGFHSHGHVQLLSSVIEQSDGHDLRVSLPIVIFNPRSNTSDMVQRLLDNSYRWTSSTVSAIYLRDSGRRERISWSQLREIKLRIAEDASRITLNQLKFLQENSPVVIKIQLPHLYNSSLGGSGNPLKFSNLEQLDLGCVYTPWLEVEAPSLKRLSFTLDLPQASSSFPFRASHFRSLESLHLSGTSFKAMTLLLELPMDTFRTIRRLEISWTWKNYVPGDPGQSTSVFGLLCQLLKVDLGQLDSFPALETVQVSGPNFPFDESILVALQSRVVSRCSILRRFEMRVENLEFHPEEPYFLFRDRVRRLQDNGLAFRINGRDVPLQETKEEEEDASKMHGRRGMIFEPPDASMLDRSQ